MKTALNKLLETIDPKITVDEVSARVDSAVNSYRIREAKITKWEEFMQEMGSFDRDLLSSLLGTSGFEADDWRWGWSHCSSLFEDQFGPNGDKIAFELARTGLQGGLLAVMQTVAKGIITEYAGREIAAKVGLFLARLSHEEVTAVADEYIARYKHLFPDDAIETHRARIPTHLASFLEQYPWQVKRLRDQWA